MVDLAKVSIIIPCRNEEAYIQQCLDSVLANDYPKERMEILVLDGMSTDRTPDIVQEYAERFPFIHLLENPKRIQAPALNLGIRQAKGEIIIRMDAHATYADDYISTCVKYMQRYEVDNVGGIMTTLSATDSFAGKTIVVALTHLFGVGGSTFRIGSKKPQWVDTVFGGCFKKKLFEKIGLYDEAIVRGEDDELNCRIRKAGGKILMLPQIRSYYYCRDSLPALANQMFRTGMWNVKKVQRNPDAFALRHWVPFGFVAVLIVLTSLALLWTPLLYIASGVLLLYAAVNIVVSALLAARKGLEYFYMLPVVFASMHFCYGFGTIIGLLRFGFPVRALVRGVYRWIREPER